MLQTLLSEKDFEFASLADIFHARRVECTLLNFIQHLLAVLLPPKV